MTPPIENAIRTAEAWEAYQGETQWSKAMRCFGELGGLAQYWCGMPRSSSAIPLTFALFAPNGEELKCSSRLKDIHAAIAFLKSNPSRQMAVVIRRCGGNTAAWGAFCGSHDWCMGTSLSLDGLVKLLGDRYPTLQCHLILEAQS